MSSPLQVGIVGAGIAGLAAAIAVSRAGHSVEIFEKSRFKNEIGAAMTITPNATAVLDRWKFDFEKSGAVEYRQFRFLKGETLEILRRESLDDINKLYGHRMWFLHRADFHEALRNQAKALGCTINLGAEAVGLDCDEGILTLANGSQHRKDLIIAADGTHCHFVSSVVGRNLPVEKTGRSVYRCLVPMDKIMANPDTAALFKSEATGMMNPVLTGSTIAQNHAIFVTYPCRRNKVLNIAIPHKTEDEGVVDNDEIWNNPAPISSVLENLKDFHPTLKTMIKMVGGDCKVYMTMDHAPVPTMHRGRTILIGDAAHPLMPTHAQGGALCLEDAGALEILLSGATKENVETRLALFSRLRVPRCATTHLLSNKIRDPPEVLRGQIRNFYKGPLPPDGSVPYSKPFRDFFFDYDIFHESERVLQGKEPVFYALQRSTGVKL